MKGKTEDGSDLYLKGFEAGPVPLIQSEKENREDEMTGVLIFRVRGYSY